MSLSPKEKREGKKKHTIVCTSAHNLLCISVRSALNMDINIWMGVETPCEPVLDHCLHMMSVESGLGSCHLREDVKILVLATRFHG